MKSNGVFVNSTYKSQCVVNNEGKCIVLVANMDNHRLMLFEEGKDAEIVEKVYSDEQNGQIITMEISEENEVSRWEGGSVDGTPYGYGIEYDKNNRRLYEGFVFRGMHVCYGREYWEDNEHIQYEGTFCDGIRMGEGTFYTREGIEDWTGRCFDTLPLDDANAFSAYPWAPTGLGEINKPEYPYYELGSFQLNNPYSTLKAIVIDVIPVINQFVIENLPELRRIRLIGREIMRRSGCDELFRVAKCPKLTNLWIGDHRCRMYTKVELEDLEELTSLRFGEMSFTMALSLELKGKEVMVEWLNG